MADYMNLASDTSDSDPESLVADLSAGQGTSYDDQAINQDNEMEREVILPLLDDVTHCESCLLIGRTLG